MREPENSYERNTQRIEAFSDGVFAIAITLLILEIKIPHLPEGSGAARLAAELRGQWPAYLAYVLSFLTIGIYWTNQAEMQKPKPCGMRGQRTA